MAPDAGQVILLAAIALLILGAVAVAVGDLERDRRERRVELQRTPEGVVEVPIPLEGLLNARGCTCDRCTYPRAFVA